MRQTFYKNDDFLIEVEALGDTVYLHCLVENWKPSVLKQIYKSFAYMEELFSRAGYERMATITPNPKFAKLFGGKTVREFEINDKPCEVIVWELKQH